MAWMFIAAMAGILVTMAMALIRAVLGPTVYDRILSVNTFGTVMVLALSVIGYIAGRPEFLDLAIIYALINFVGTIAVLKFLRYGDLGKATTEEDGDV
jgi:multicomponent Na+:H+ antiporter subunit F